MRILSFANCPPDDRTGSGYVIRRFSEGLRAAGHEVDLLGPADFEPFHGFAPGRAVAYRQAAGMAVQALRLVGRGDYDVVELWGATGWLSAEILARVPGATCLQVFRSNGLEPHCEELMSAAESRGEVPRLKRWYHRSHSFSFVRALRHADGVITVSEWERDWALARGLGAPGRILAVENALPDSLLDLEPPGDRGAVLGYCGSWLPRKGTALLTTALPEILREFPEWRLRLVGVGDDFRSGEHFPADLLPRIEVIPFAAREGCLRDLYQSFAIALMPSVYESFGLVSAEAMACGAALVATRVGFAAGLHHGEEAWLLPKPSPSALEEALRILMRDRELRGRIARGGHRRVQRLRWGAAVEAVETVYRRWTEERVRGKM
jgi:glycosyltransferase involved in cell wall biosynthesis